MIGVDGALYQVAWSSPARAWPALTMDDRLSICNMAIEAGCQERHLPRGREDHALTCKATQPARCRISYEADPDADVREDHRSIDLEHVGAYVSLPPPAREYQARSSEVQGHDRSIRWSSAAAPTAALDDMRRPPQHPQGQARSPRACAASSSRDPPCDVYKERMPERLVHGLH